MELNELWGALGLDAGVLTQGDLEVHSPIDGAVMARVKTDSAAGLEEDHGRGNVRCAHGHRDDAREFETFVSREHGKLDSAERREECRQGSRHPNPTELAGVVENGQHSVAPGRNPKHPTGPQA